MGESFGAFINRLREERRWTQTDLALKAGLALSTIQKIEAREDAGIAKRSFRDLAAAFGMSTAQLSAAWQNDEWPERDQFITDWCSDQSAQTLSAVLTLLNHITRQVATELQKHQPGEGQGPPEQPDGRAAAQRAARKTLHRSDSEQSPAAPHREVG